MQHKNWSCPKCQRSHFETGEIRVSGGFWSKVFDVQNRKYFAVTCEHCSYTEFYKGESSTAGDIFDLFSR